MQDQGMDFSAAAAKFVGLGSIKTKQRHCRFDDYESTPVAS